MLESVFLWCGVSFQELVACTAHSTEIRDESWTGGGGQAQYYAHVKKLLVASLFLVVRPGAPSSFLLRRFVPPTWQTTVARASTLAAMGGVIFLRRCFVILVRFCLVDSCGHEHFERHWKGKHVQIAESCIFCLPIWHLSHFHPSMHWNVMVFKVVPCMLTGT